MSLLESVHSGRRHKPPRLLIYGTECSSFPLAQSFEDVLGYLAAGDRCPALAP